jgi:tRNA dimethylallyltransferase
MITDKIRIVVVTGPTATGKTHFGVRLCHAFNGEVISVDSRQVYRRMDLGTGKDLDEYQVDGQPVPYHLIDIVEPTDEYNLQRFMEDATQAVKDISSRGGVPFVIGGTALYLNALISGYELPGNAPEIEQRQQLRSKSTQELGELLKSLSERDFCELDDKQNPIRLIRAIEKIQHPTRLVTSVAEQLEPLLLGVYYPRKTVHQRIEERLHERFKNGMIDEVEALHNSGVSWEKLEFFGLEYRFIALYLQHKMTLDEMKEKLLIKIRQFAKRQDIWFRKMERQGWRIHWIPEGDYQTGFELIRMFLANEKLPKPTIRLDDIRYGPKSS